MKPLLPALFLLLSPLVLRAQKFAYNVNFDYLFDNSEYDRSNNFNRSSGTLHAVRLTPAVGLEIGQGEKLTHKLMAGIDVMKNFGEGFENGKLFREITFFYDLKAELPDGGHFNMTAGCFPRRFTEEDYCGPFFSNASLFCDNNLEGILFKYRRDGVIRAELGLDWIGMIGDREHPERRERFRILSSGRWDFAGPFHFGWTGVFYHFACSPERPNVVDNHLLSLWFGWEPQTCLDELSVKAGALLSYQYDRHFADGPVSPAGFLTRQTLRKWNVGLDNRLFAGPDMQPLYDKYGDELYPGDRMYHTRLAGASWSDRLSVYYSPRIADFLDLVVGFSFNFGNPVPSEGIPVFRGWKQIIALRFKI